MQIHTIDIDLGKTIFHLVGELSREMVVRKRFSRAQLLRFTPGTRLLYTKRDRRYVIHQKSNL